MKTVRANVVLYPLTDFGYFPLKGQRGVKKGVSLDAFGTLAESMKDLKKWVGKLSLGQTATSEPSGDSLMLYCKGLVEHHGDWTLGLVQEAPTSAGGVLQFDLSSPVGSVAASATPVEDGNVAGWATHYWFLPAEQIVASVRVDHSPPSKAKLLRYVKGFMARYASCVVEVGDDGAVKYRSPRGDLLSCRVKFNLDPGRDAAMEKRILSGQVKRVFLREDVKTYLPGRKSKSGKTSFLSLFAPELRSAVGMTQDVTTSRVEVEVTRKFTKAQVKTLIEGWQSEVDPWRNLGFEVEEGGQRSNLWLERQRHTSLIDLRVELDERGVVNLASLAAALKKQKSAILASVGSS